MKPDDYKIEAIKNLKNPQNKKELQSILGAINYLRGFIPNLSEVTAPLRDLLKNNTSWLWTERQSKALDEIKKILMSPPVLVSFVEDKSVIIQTDASQNGLGCCLLQDNRPVAFASRSLTDSETRFSQIEKEFLAIYWSCSKFHNFVYGRHSRV